jgi:hypothetical protein
MIKPLFKALFIVIDIIFSVYLASPVDIIEKRIFNLKNADIIGISRKLPKGMGSSLAWEESRGFEGAVGKNKSNDFYSYGLFQINETCEEELANKYLPGGYKNYDRKNPAQSALIGCSYLYDLHEKFGSWKKALCAYNWGPGNVSKCRLYSDIPFDVREYARKILSRIIEEPHDYLLDINKEAVCEKQIEFHEQLLFYDVPKIYRIKRTI